MDRTIAPKVEPIKEFDYIKAQKTVLDNGVELFYINQPRLKVIKLEIVFDAGYSKQLKPLQAAAIASLIKEGTKIRNSESLATEIDNQGAVFQASSKADSLELTLYCLTSKLKELLPVVIDMLENSIFPEEELSNFIANSKEKFNINQQKVAFLVKNEFIATIYGEKHPYNNKINVEDFDNIKREDLLWYFKEYIKNKKYTLYASGKVGKSEIQELQYFFGQNKIISTTIDSKEYTSIITQSQSIFIEKAEANQVALRLGKSIIGKDHEDFPALFFTNTLLGGFFGSRLMSNIREDKGYTYGIGSGLVSLKNNSYFFIASELGVDYLGATIEEIKKEIERLQKEDIPENEVELVKNYLQGNMMKNFDGAFDAMSRFKSIHILGLDYSYYDKLFKAFYQMDSAKINKIAEQYLNYESFHTLVAGKSNFKKKGNLL